MSSDPGLAPERTALAWQRTGLTHMAMGGALLRLLPGTAFRPALAATMIVVGAIASIGGRRIDLVRPHRAWLLFLAASTTAISFAALALSFA